MSKPSLKLRLDSTIYSLELMQKSNYSASTNLVLSYLYDIQKNDVPEHTITQYLRYCKQQNNKGVPQWYTQLSIIWGLYSIAMNQKPNYYKALQIAAAMTPHEEVFTKEEEAELEESLKGLGYIWKS